MALKIVPDSKPEPPRRDRKLLLATAAIIAGSAGLTVAVVYFGGLDGLKMPKPVSAPSAAL